MRIYVWPDGTWADPLFSDVDPVQQGKSDDFRIVNLPDDWDDERIERWVADNPDRNTNR